MTEYYAHYDSPLGGITLVSNGEALTWLLFDDEKGAEEVLKRAEDPASGAADYPASSDGELAASAETEAPVFSEAKRWLDIYFSGEEPDFIPPLGPEGTPFRRAVWEILRQIPYGETVTYGQVAERIARQQGRERMSAQAVGGAVGHNPISLIVPCHRVIGADGSLTGYAGGVDRKAALLALENHGRQNERQPV